MDVAEQLYRERMAQLSGAERVALSLGMFAEIEEAIRLRLRSQNPKISEADVRLAAAESIYITDWRARSLVQKAKVDAGR